MGGKVVSTKKVKLEVKTPTSWELAIADAEERVARLHRSIEMFRQNIKAGVPFPVSPATQN
jgi:hypothetical protein